jgi:carbamoyltransferase
VTEVLEALRQQSGAKFLCLAGGLFLNPLIVRAVEKNTGFEQVFVQPAAGNEGTALGAAWLALHQIQKKPRSAPLERLDYGPSYSNAEIKLVLDNCKVCYHLTELPERKIDEALKFLHAGKIVAWFQGAAEFGPRALGHRSLFASPWAPYVKENLNDYVKHREPYRAFALCVREEDCSRYFDCSRAGRFMTTMGSVHQECRKILEQFVLPGNLVRLHVVEQGANPLLWRLLQRFGVNSPAPFLINTSFNLFSEPLVITPRDAIRSYFCSGTDALIAGDFVLLKS